MVIALSSSALMLLGSLLKDIQGHKEALVLLMWLFVKAILSKVLSQIQIIKYLVNRGTQIIQQALLHG